MGSVAVAQDQLESVWGIISPTSFASGSRRGRLRRGGAAILARFPSSEGYYVLTAGEFLQAVQLVLSRFFVAAWVLEVVAALISVIGVVNAQVATVLDRATEIGTLRTIGLSSGDLTRSVLLECGALGAIGGSSGSRWA